MSFDDSCRVIARHIKVDNGRNTKCVKGGED